jgi:replication-associated recombination protein RarA
MRGGFGGVVGQPAAVAALEAILARTGGQGATLIHGPEGTGRFLLAQCAAKAILGDTALVDAGTHPDLIVFSPDTMGIDEVRDSLSGLSWRPLLAPRQVLLIRDFDRFHGDVHHFLLKTLEEPPAGAAVFLVAEDPSLLPATVISRCRLVRTLPLSDADTARVLGVRPEAAADAEGSPGRGRRQAALGASADAEILVETLLGRRDDPLGAAEQIVRKRKDEEKEGQRVRLIETCRVAADRLRRRLPETERALRPAVEALRSLLANANPSIVFAGLALVPWTHPKP